MHIESVFLNALNLQFLPHPNHAGFVLNFNILSLNFDVEVVLANDFIFNPIEEDALLRRRLSLSLSDSSPSPPF